MSSETEQGGMNRRKFLALGRTAAFTAAVGLSLDLKSAGPASGAPAEMRIYGLDRRAFERARERARAMTSAMTTSEKVSQLGKIVPAIPRLNLPAYNYNSCEALHGLCRSGPVTSFPVPLALANTWNPDLQLRIYTAVSDEARAYYNKSGTPLAFYSPQTLNTARDPRWGRVEETLGEDVHLISVMALQTVRGMQGDDPHYLKTICCAKHFIANETDSDRHSVSESVDARSFWEYYSRPFEACVVQGHVFSVMGAYNSMNGIPCCADTSLLTRILRDRWGFRGYVASDHGAVSDIFSPHHYAHSLAEACAMTIKAGCDVDNDPTCPGYLMEAYQENLVTNEDLTVALTRVLTGRFLLGEFDPSEHCPYYHIPFSVVGSAKHRALALDAARQSIVLLKNNGILPLDRSRIKSVAVIGPTAGSCHLGGYSGRPLLHTSPLEGIAEALGLQIPQEEIWASSVVKFGGAAHTEISSEGGMDVGFIHNNSWVEFPRMDFTGKTEMVARVASATQGGAIDVHLDRLNGPLAATFNVAHTGGWQDWVNKSVPLHDITGKHRVFLRFKGGAGGLLNLEWIKLNPPARPAPPAPGKPGLVFKPGCSIKGERDDTMFNEAVAAAKSADVAIVVAGVNQSVDSEGRDRPDIALTGVQHELIRAIYQANPRTVLVISSNAPVAVNWEQDNLPAIVAALFAGQAQGTAIADVLFGNYNPGGKLASTWYRSIQDLPPFHNFDITKHTYMYFKGDPLYPFGHGLSYTTFRIEGLSVQGRRLEKGGSVMVSVKVTNTGTREGAEVVQLYVRPPESSVARPDRQLVDFQRVVLKPGQAKQVHLKLAYEAPALSYWDVAKSAFVLQPGTVELMVGTSSTHIIATAQIEVA